MNIIIPAVIPPHVSVDVHMKLTNDRWKSDPATGAFMSWFYQKVRGHGPWDYKQQNHKWENFGNFHYGAVGRAGQLSEQLLLRAAGFAQKEAETQDPEIDWGHWFWRAPYGDDPKDQTWIERGIRYAELKGY
ncbi:bacteriocin [Pseudomonas coronafaciens pv. porri]|uniref:Bacteriocin n=1 Tax=Pseudomonas coronafaciens pv. porri TaxID=83964 RepID=A0ABR5JJH5_9PSED|nr:polymorphic toxin type 44 domain-containing protein [Pseudomonas coronafaciens]KOP53780.1 bacteriocin [Pseudomonas coronafaciens pv. porri]